jgi:hypothetical protein
MGVVPLECVAACITRWSSILNLCVRFAQLHPYVCILLAQGYFGSDDLDDPAAIPSTSQVRDYTAIIVELLAPLRNVTLFLQGSRYIVSAHVPHIVRYLISHYNSLMATGTGSLRALAGKMRDELSDRLAPYIQPESPLTIAAVLHPVYSLNVAEA